MNKNYSVHYKAVPELMKVLKIVQREHPILIEIFLMCVYFAFTLTLYVVINYTEKKRYLNRLKMRIPQSFGLQAFQGVVKYCYSLINECPRVIKCHFITHV